MKVDLLLPECEDWPALVEELRRLLGAPDNPALFPPHFLQVTLRRIGGAVALFGSRDRPAAVGFLFPRRWQQGRPAYLMRFHPLVPGLVVDGGGLARAVAERLAAAAVAFYDPLGPHQFSATGEATDGLNIGAPGPAEAEAIRAYQGQVWGAEPDFLYPTDVHAADFDCGFSLVARVDQQLAGFLFGFYRFGEEPPAAAWGGLNWRWRLESQVLAVLPAHRGRGIATRLKQAQAQHCLAQGIQVMQWTADPLQFPNAVLNFCHLGAVAGHFWTDLYPFRNELNQVNASRAGITWLLPRPRSQALLDLAIDPLPLANEGPDRVRLDLGAEALAIEVPGDWTRLQRQAPDEALRWRETTDQLFGHYLGFEAGRYLLAGAARLGARCFLVARRVTPALLAELGA